MYWNIFITTKKKQKELFGITDSKHSGVGVDKIIRITQIQELEITREKETVLL